MIENAPFDNLPLETSSMTNILLFLSPMINISSFSTNQNTLKIFFSVLGLYNHFLKQLAPITRQMFHVLLTFLDSINSWKEPYLQRERAAPIKREEIAYNKISSVIVTLG